MFNGKHLVLCTILFLVFLTIQLDKSYGYRDGEAAAKVRFIYNLIRFFRWPNIDARKEFTITICSKGRDVIFTELKAYIRLHHSGGLGYDVELIEDVLYSQLDSCNILYISDSESDKLRKILNEVGAKPIFTVSSIPSFAAHGGIIGFFTVEIAPEKYKVRLAVNINAAKKANLTIDTRLLEIVRIVDYGEF